MIYAAHILDQQFVKIGFSSDEDASVRIASLQTGNPFHIQLLFKTVGTLMQEQAVHKALGDAFARIRVPMPPNEWYPGRHPVFVEFLDYLKSGGPNSSMMFLDKYNQSVKQPGKGMTSLERNIKWPKR